MSASRHKILHLPLYRSGNQARIAWPGWPTFMGFSFSSLTSPSLSSLPPLLLHFFAILSLPSSAFVFPPLRSKPLLRLWGLRERSSSPSRSGQSLAAKRFLANCKAKNIAPIVAMVLRFTVDTSTWSIAKYAIAYVTLYVNHNIPSTLHWYPKFSVLYSAEWKTHQKQCIIGASGRFFSRLQTGGSVLT